MVQGHFEQLDAAECAQLLREASIGRVAFVGPDGMTVLPLAYVVDGEDIILRTAAGTQLASLGAGTPVAFEVDEFDPEVRNGWSVLARGRLGVLDPSREVREVPEPFVPGEREVLVTLAVESLSGRAVSGD